MISKLERIYSNSMHGTHSTHHFVQFSWFLREFILHIAPDYVGIEISSSNFAMWDMHAHACMINAIYSEAGWTNKPWTFEIHRLTQQSGVIFLMINWHDSQPGPSNPPRPPDTDGPLCLGAVACDFRAQVALAAAKNRLASSMGSGFGWVQRPNWTTHQTHQMTSKNISST